MPFQKGHPQYGHIRKGQKHRNTLLQEERRAIFDNEISQKWKKTINKLRPEYIADQFMGKAPDKIEHSGEIKNKSDLNIEKLAENLSKELKKKKI